MVDASRDDPQRNLEIERALLAEDRSLQPLQRLARLEPKLVIQQLARLSIDLERVRLPARAVQGEHQLAAQTLLKWVRFDQGLELGDNLGGAPQREIGLDPLHHSPQPQFLEPPYLCLRKLERRQVGKCRSAPESERLA
jgi:hypothetical protein